MDTDNPHNPRRAAAREHICRLVAACVMFLVVVPGPATNGAATAAQIGPPGSLPHVVILATGGTIAGQAPSTTDSAYQAAKLGVNTLIKANFVTGQVLESPIRGPAGGIVGRRVFFFRDPQRNHTGRPPFSLDGVTALPRIDILYAHSNMSADLIDAAVRAGAKGLVIAGTGTGNMTDLAIEVLARAVSKGVLAVRSTRMGSGLILRNQEIDDDKYGFIASDELNPSKARVLLQLALLTTSDRSRIQEFFNTY